MSRTYWIGAIASLLFAGCDLGPRWTLSSPQFYPVAIDYWKLGDVFLVGGYHEGQIASFGADGVARRSVDNLFASGIQHRLYRLKVDQVRQRLWTLGSEGVIVYELPSGKVASYFKFPITRPNVKDCFPDIALGEDGSAYISDITRPGLRRISSDMSTVEEIKVEGATQQWNLEGISALAQLDGGTLLAGNAASGRVWSIDIPTMRAREFLSDTKFVGVCEISVVNNDWAVTSSKALLIYLRTGFQGRVFEIDVNKNGGIIVTSMFWQRRRSGVPIAGHIFNRFLLIADSQLNHHSDFGGSHNPNLPFRVAVYGMPLPRNLDVSQTLKVN